jgi:hypothetical protein
MRLRSIALAWALAASAAHGQLMPVDPEWREAQIPPPPAFKSDGLIPLDIPGSALKFGVDPASVSIGEDRVVRYVVVASSNTGAMNAMYEGIRCNTGEYKVYARYNPGSGWSPTQDFAWRPVHAQPASRHTLLVARTGACLGRGANRSASQVVHDLRSPVDRRFVN